jgi:hypothetical protein
VRLAPNRLQNILKNQVERSAWEREIDEMEARFYGL